VNRHVNPRTLEARALRQGSEPAERVLWEALRGRRLGGFKFRRQVPVGPHFADFLCHERAVVIVVEQGAVPCRDSCNRARDEYFMGEGFAVFRVPASNVLNDQPAVCAALRAILDERIEAFVEGSFTAPRSPVNRRYEAAQPHNR
jgi:very-short-patch-repair endonuclease